jgi:threonine dehydrogenase-like Zn-dependent dehydrogenase
MAAENAEIEPGDTVAIWGCGPVGQFAIQSAWMLGAGRVIAIDRVPERLKMAEEKGKAEVINFEKGEGGVYDRFQEMTNGAAGPIAASMRSRGSARRRCVRRRPPQGEGFNLSRDRSPARPA